MILSFLSGVPAVAFMAHEQHLYALAVLAVGCVTGLTFAGTLLLEQRRRIRISDVTGEPDAPTRARIDEPREEPSARRAYGESPASACEHDQPDGEHVHAPGGGAIP